jgi:hypothetical protein
MEMNSLIIANAILFPEESTFSDLDLEKSTIELHNCNCEKNKNQRGACICIDCKCHLRKRTMIVTNDISLEKGKTIEINKKYLVGSVLFIGSIFILFQYYHL